MEHAVSARYFRAVPAVYVQVCQQLDAAYGYPNPAFKTERTLPLVDTLPTDDSGRVYLAVDAAFCEFNLPSEMLAQLITAGLVDELTEAEYVAVVPQPLM